MSVRNFDKLFQPHSVALIGASDRPGSVGAVVLRNLNRALFRGELSLVNPHHQTLAGLPVYPTVADLPPVPDLPVIVTPPDPVPGLIYQLGSRGTKAAAFIPSPFRRLRELRPPLPQPLP